MKSDDNNAVDISHYSDVLCVWAYIAQIRIDKLCAEFEGQVTVGYRFLQVFGDTRGKIATQWTNRGGLEGYAAHVQEVAQGFEHVQVNPRAWLENTPSSSGPAHLVLAGARVLLDEAGNGGAAIEPLLKAIRHAFFMDLADISQVSVLLDIAQDAGLDRSALRETLDDGRAHAGYLGDLAAAAQNYVRSSPTLSFNEGRQVLAGNVGYRVLEANIRELLRQPGDQQSWC